jgi:hypothetical protein
MAVALRSTRMGLWFLAAAGLSSCGGSSATGADAGQALLEPGDGRRGGGEVEFVRTEGGVRVVGTLSGLGRGSEYRLVLSEAGCGSDRADKLGSLYSDESGRATVDMVVTGFEIGTGVDQDVIGRAVAVGPAADESRRRIACGLVEPVFAEQKTG